jgi:hypothetical protein
MKRIKLHLDAFEYDVEVRAGEDFDKFCAYVDRVGLGPMDDERRHGSGNGLCVSTSQRSIIWLAGIPKTPRQIACLSHELLHAALYCLGARGVPIETENHETLTYHHGYLLTQALEKLDVLKQ